MHFGKRANIGISKRNGTRISLIYYMILYVWQIIYQITMDLLLLELMKKRIMLLAIVHSCLYCKKVIDVIVIRNDRNTPYYLTEQYQGVFANNIYSRIMDTNTPKNASADIDVIEKLWKKRFGIDATALDRALLFLQKPYYILWVELLWTVDDVELPPLGHFI